MEYDLFITCSQGLEPLLCEELKELGFNDVRAGYRGAHLSAGLEAIYKINYGSRIASRVLLPLHHFRCFNQDQLYASVKEIDWMPFFRKAHTLAIDANVTHKYLRNSLFAAQVAKDAICDQLRERTGSRPSVDTKTPDIQLNLFIRDMQGTIYLDTSGTPLHKRNYRIDSVEAPLQESLAAAIIKIANPSENDIILDPCCGSGTLLIEAALIASKTPPGYLRSDWGFRHIPGYSHADFLKVKAELDKDRLTLAPGRFFGCDVNKDAVRISKGNLRASGFHQAVQIAHSDFRDFTPEIAPTLVITNPPHGLRMGEVESLRGMYRALGDFLKHKTAKPSRAFVFTGNLELSKEVGLAPKRRHVVHSGGVEGRLLEFDLY